MILALLSLLTLQPVLSVPPRSQDHCLLPPAWEDVWREAGQESQVTPGLQVPDLQVTLQISIVDNNIGSFGQCVLKLEDRQATESFILRNNR